MINSNKEFRGIKNQYKKRFNSLPFAIILLNLNGKINFLNKKAEKLFNTNCKSFTGKSLISVSNFTEIFKKKLIDILEELKNGYIFGPENLNIQLNEKFIRINVYASQIKILDKFYIQIIIKEIQEEDSLKIVVDKKFKEIIENSIEGYFEVDIEGNFTFVNDVFSRLWGYKKEELLVMNYKDLLNKEDAKRIFNIFNKLYIVGDKIKNFQYKIKTKSDGLLYGESTIYLRSDTSGNNIGFSGFVRDISEQKRSQLKLMESEEKFRSIAEQSVLGIFIIQNNVIRYVNNRFVELIGYNIDLVKNWKLEDVKSVFYKGHLSFILEQIEKKEIGIKDNIQCFHVKYINKIGESFWVENIIQSINFKGSPAALISVLDITKQKEAEDLIMEENERLKELDIIRKNFLDRASHELKTPLTSVYGASQLLTDLIKDYDKKKEKIVKELIEIINQGSEKLTKLISNLLDISKLESNNLKLEKTEIDIVNLINRCVNDLKYLLKKRNHSIIKNLPNEFKINIDKSRIERVITNLLSNAINYTPSGGLIKINLKELEDNIEISISDTGIGLAKEHLEKLFRKFVHIEKPSDEYDIKLNGTGLGLYISKEIIELHKGKISAKSNGLNKGSTFIFSLPIN